MFYLENFAHPLVVFFRVEILLQIFFIKTKFFATWNQVFTFYQTELSLKFKSKSYKNVF